MVALIVKLPIPLKSRDSVLHHLKILWVLIFSDGANSPF